MRDLVILAVTVGFFALCVAYVALCDRVIGADPPAGADAAAEPLRPGDTADRRDQAGVTR